MKKFDNGAEIEFVNPNCDFFCEDNLSSSGLRQKMYEPETLARRFPIDTYDIAHFHFEYHHISVTQLETLLKYFKNNNKFVVWTCHDRRSNDFTSVERRYEQLLFDSADKIITLTNGCKKWLQSEFGAHKTEISVQSHGYIETPTNIRKFSKLISKDSDLFTILLGNLRPNKEYLESVLNFLLLTELKNKKLRLLFNPITLSQDNKFHNDNLLKFSEFALSHPRVETYCSSFINHDVITKTFLESHAIILPYKWGTHSGQVELARDCGCHVVAPNVGFYHQQWEKVELWDVSDDKKSQFSNRYAQALINVSRRESLQPSPNDREKEFELLLQNQYQIYKKGLNNLFK